VIALSVNGKRVELEGPTALPDYLGALGVDRRAVAVEVNGEIVQREAYDACTLGEGDVVEIVRMVGGGSATADPVDRWRSLSRLGRRLSSAAASGSGSAG
jgi:thiamine biosynthesis protein ThiS